MICPARTSVNSFSTAEMRWSAHLKLVRAGAGVSLSGGWGERFANQGVAVALNGALPNDLPHINATRPPSLVISRNVHVS